MIFSFFFFPLLFFFLSFFFFFFFFLGGGGGEGKVIVRNLYLLFFINLIVGKGCLLIMCRRMSICLHHCPHDVYICLIFLFFEREIEL